jgi:[histone H3]-trimethyl-L-lysine4 demethylase
LLSDALNENSPKPQRMRRASTTSHQSLSTTKSFPERDFKLVKQMMEFHPTEEEFMQPLEYVDRLYHEGAWKYGCIKIIPPKSFKPSFGYDTTSQQKLPFRSQHLHNLSKGKVGF